MSELLIVGCGGLGRMVGEVALATGKWSGVRFLDDAVRGDAVVGKCVDYTELTGSYTDAVAAFGENRLRLAHWFTVDDLNHLKRGGRVSGAAAFFGTMLSIKPVLHVDDEGHLIPMERCAAAARVWMPWWSTWLKRASTTPIRRCSSATATARTTWNMWRSRFASGSAPQIFI